MSTDAQSGNARLTVQYPDLETEPVDIHPEEAPSFRKVEDSLPESVKGVAGRGTDMSAEFSGISVRAEKSSLSLDSGHSYGENYRPVPAGAACRTDPNNPDAYCTTGTPAFDDNNGDIYIVTAGHCFDPPGLTDFWQYDLDTTPHGNLEESGFDADGIDGAIVAPNTFNDHEHDYASDNGGYRNVDIVGASSRNRLMDMENEGTEIRKQGASTGIETGVIQNVGTNYFWTNLHRDVGDSGGPVYDRRYSHQVGYYSYISGVHSGSDNIGTRHTMMERLENYFNIYV